MHRFYCIVPFGDRRQKHVTGNSMVVMKLVPIEGNNHNEQFPASSTGQRCAIFADSILDYSNRLFSLTCSSLHVYTQKSIYFLPEKTFINRENLSLLNR